MRTIEGERMIVDTGDPSEKSSCTFLPRLVLREMNQSEQSSPTLEDFLSRRIGHPG